MTESHDSFIEISTHSVSGDPIDYKQFFDNVMAWHGFCSKPWPESVMQQFYDTYRRHATSKCWSLFFYISKIRVHRWMRNVNRAMASIWSSVCWYYGKYHLWYSMPWCVVIHSIQRHNEQCTSPSVWDMGRCEKKVNHSFLCFPWLKFNTTTFIRNNKDKTDPWLDFDQTLSHRIDIYSTSLWMSLWCLIV